MKKLLLLVLVLFIGAVIVSHCTETPPTLEIEGEWIGEWGDSLSLSSTQFKYTIPGDWGFTMEAQIIAFFNDQDMLIAQVTYHSLTDSESWAATQIGQYFKVVWNLQSPDSLLVIQGIPQHSTFQSAMEDSISLDNTPFDPSSYSRSSSID